MAVARTTLDRFTSMKSDGLALLLSAPTETTATAPTDAELARITAALLSGFPGDNSNEDTLDWQAGYPGCLFNSAGRILPCVWDNQQ